jgi:subtilase family serine protease
MLPEYLRNFSRRHSQVPRRRPAEARRLRRFALRPELESLEERLTLTGNMTITGVSVVGANDQPLPVVSVGESVYIQADFTTQGLPRNASYRVGYTDNGLTLDTGYLDWGAGSLGTGYWVAYWGTFIASPGANQVTVTVDPDHSVAETSYADNTMSFTFNTVPESYTVAQMRAAYGITGIPDFGSATADGSGQTIAIVDVYNDPNILTDLDGFDQVMDLTTNSSESLYQQYGPASSILTVYNQAGTDITSEISNSGVGGVPQVDPPGDWQGEETMDVEWAHAIAPGAHIDLIECDGTGNIYGLFSGAATAAELPGVSVVSMSSAWSEGNWSGSNGSGELAYDSSTFVTPSGHPGVTFLASSGDGGNPGGYPAFSPNVVAVGGTQLSLNGDTYGSETGWSFPVPRALVNGGPSYSQTGPWTSQPGGFSLTYSAAAAGSDSSATWTSPLAPSDLGWGGGTEVSATWVANPGNATNAKYEIWDVSEPSATFASATLMGIVTVDQTKAPVGTAAGSVQFQELGDYYPRNGSTLEVELDANTADGTVVADAVGIAPSWASGGGQSLYESEPSYQLPFQSTGYRTTPDVSFDASQNSGVTVFQDGGLAYDYFGTSLSSPCWAGLIAIANQGRVASGGTTLNSPANPMQTLQALYSLPAGDFHDITSGYNGLSAGAGYDEVTGRGSPIANLLVPDLASYGLPSQLVITSQPPATVAAERAFGLNVAVEDRFGDVITNFNGTVTIAIGNNPGRATLGGTLTVTVVNGIATFSGLRLNNLGIGYTLEASSAGLAAATTRGFTVRPAPILRLVVTAQPTSGVTAGSEFGLTVEAEDQFGDVATSYTGGVTVALASRPRRMSWSMLT